MKNKKKLLLIGIIVVVTGLGVGGFFVFQNVNQQPTQTIEQNATISTEEALSRAEQQTSTSEDTTTKALQGTFVDADAIHSGEGTAVVTQTNDGPVLVFKSDFSVTPGPDLFVYLSPNAAGDPLGEFVSLGKLQNDKGEQVYTLPDNYQDFKSVVIWCRAFGTKFSYADLN